MELSSPAHEPQVARRMPRTLHASRRMICALSSKASDWKVSWLDAANPKMDCRKYGYLAGSPWHDLLGAYLESFSHPQPHPSRTSNSSASIGPHDPAL